MSRLDEIEERRRKITGDGWIVLYGYGVDDNKGNLLMYGMYYCNKCRLLTADPNAHGPFELLKRTEDSGDE